MSYALINPFYFADEKYFHCPNFFYHAWILYVFISFCMHVGNVAGMAEDGSFIGKYSKDRNPEQTSAFDTFV